MLKKAIWFIVMLGMSGFMYFGPEGGGGEDTPTPTVESPTSTVAYTATTNPTVKPTNTLTATATKIPTLVNTATTIPTNTQIPTKTKTPLPTNTSTPAPTLSATVVPPTATLQNFPYNLQPSTPIYLTNFVHLAEGCNWQGVAGQVFDTSGKPVSNLMVKVTGKLGDRTVSEIAVTGMVDGLPYGPGSFEVFLGLTPVFSNNTLQIQIFDANQNALSAPIKFITRKACDKSLTLINFIQK